MEREGNHLEHNERKEHQLDERPAGGDSLIVGIGASAGGIQALEEFFQEVPADSGIAYVVILHLSPSHDSKLAEVLQNTAVIPVKQVTERVKIEPNQVYVVPPNQHLMMEGNYINVSLNTVMEERRAPVDIFFRTLADEHGSRAVSVVLSGTGANGSMGLKRIKERGGATFVQNPREAEFNEMPRNAIATEMVDEVLPVAAIPAKIIAYRNSLGTIRIADDVRTHTTSRRSCGRYSPTCGCARGTIFQTTNGPPYCAASSGGSTSATCPIWRPMLITCRATRKRPMPCSKTC